MDLSDWNFYRIRLVLILLEGQGRFSDERKKPRVKISFFGEAIRTVTYFYSTKLFNLFFLKDVRIRV